MVLFVRGFIGVLSLVCFVGAWQAGCGDSGGGGASDSGLFTDASGMDASRDAALDGAQSPDGGQSLPDGGPEEDAGPQGPCVGWTRSNLKFVGDFETGDLEGFNVSGNAPTVTDTRVRMGRYAMRSSLDRFNDPVSYRTEVVALETPKTMVRDDMWYGFSVFLPDSYVSDPVWEIVAQWHGRPDFDLGEDWRNPPLALHTSNGVWTLSNIWDAKENTFESGERVYDGSRRFELGPYDTGRWTDWVFHVKWAYEDDGILQVWQDGRLVVDAPGPNTFNDQQGPYFKMGIYKGWKDPETPGNVDTRLLFHDEVRIGTADADYCDVAPGEW